MIIELNGDEDDMTCAAFRDQVRRAISALTITVEYKDIYGRSISNKVRDLKWFGRHFDGDQLTTTTTSSN